MLKNFLGFLSTFLIVLVLLIVSYMPPKQEVFWPKAAQNDSSKSGTYILDNVSHPYKYSFSFVEMNDDGIFSDEKQINHVIDDLKSKVNETDTVILLYVHGWNHNARADDSNVACFEELVKATAIMQSTYPASDRKSLREVYGIYVGWPAVVYNNETLNKAVTFFSRQSVADRIGERGDLLQFFSMISQLRHEHRRQETKFVIVSHSLGARLTYKALRPIMQHSVYELDSRKNESDSDKNLALADVAVLVNPAISAEEHTVLAKLMDAQVGPTSNKRQFRFIIATSENDEVLRSIYPWSQKISSFVRGDYWLENKKRVLPVGLDDEYVTHVLKLKGLYENSSGTKECPTLRHDELEIVKGAGRLRNGANREQKVAELSNYRTIVHYDEKGTNEIYRTELEESGNKSKGPIMVVKVSEKIIPNHNDIFSSPFVDFVSRVGNAVVYGQQQTRDAQ